MPSSYKRGMLFILQGRFLARTDADFLPAQGIQPPDWGSPTSDEGWEGFDKQQSNEKKTVHMQINLQN